MREKITDFLVWLAVCLLFSGLMYTLIYFKIKENKLSDDIKVDDGIMWLEDSDSVEVIGSGLLIINI